MAEDPHCHWCGTEVVNDERDGKTPPPWNAATIDHLGDRINGDRPLPGLPTVLACRKCNEERANAAVLAQPVEERRRRSKYHQYKRQGGQSRNFLAGQDRARECFRED